jgi:hypothetical protein
VGHDRSLDQGASIAPEPHALWETNRVAPHLCSLSLTRPFVKQWGYAILVGRTMVLVELLMGMFEWRPGSHSPGASLWSSL